MKARPERKGTGRVDTWVRSDSSKRGGPQTMHPVMVQLPEPVKNSYNSTRWVTHMENGQEI